MTIPVILASQSPSRRKVLRGAGINPIVSVSHVDEPAAVAAEAREQGVSVDELSCEQRVMILAQAKADAVYGSYRAVADVAGRASGDQVTAFPLEADEARDDGGGDGEDGEPSGSIFVSAGAAEGHAGAGHASTLTRDFSDVDVPTQSEPLQDTAATASGFTGSQSGPLIVGCDSMFLFEGESLGKPHTPEVARRRLRAMRGKSGELWTGHCVIDFATGRRQRATSRAIVRFADFTDGEIEAYIASGEPLEVAGCFTLEGLGGAFIEGVDGDPSGVLGLSLPLLRRMVMKLGFAWTDLWNSVPGSVEELPVVSAGGQSHDDDRAKSSEAASVAAPKDNIHQPGDGWVDCACGRRHWGVNGAAGVLLARRDAATGKVTDIVMQHRAVWSAEGGTWGVPGGALADGESPIEGALRESYEEANITPGDIEVVGTHREEHGPWAYTTVLAFEKPGHCVDPKPNDDESLTIEWVPVAKVPDLKLLTAFRTDWPRFAKRLDELAGSYVGR